MVHKLSRVEMLCVLFQAEDGIRDYKVTGVQTCALPIYIVVVGHHRSRWAIQSELSACHDHERNCLATSTPNEPAMASTSQRSRSQVFTIPTVVNAITIIFDTKPQRYHV